MTHTYSNQMAGRNFWDDDHLFDHLAVTGETTQSRSDVDWTANVAAADASFVVVTSSCWMYLPSDLPAHVLTQLADRIAWDAFLAQSSAPAAAARARKFWIQCRKVTPNLPVPISILGKASVEMTWHQDDRYLELDVPASGRARCFISFGSEHTDLMVDLDRPAKKFLAALSTFGHA